MFGHDRFNGGCDCPTHVRATTTGSCALQNVTPIFTNSLCVTSLIHLVLISGERYLAMKHTFAYSTGLVTEARLLICSALAWLFSFILHIPLFIDNTVYFVINNSIIVLSLAIIIFCQIMVYREVRRHEKELSTQQVTEQARQHFLKDKKAFKLTAIIVSAGPAQQDFDWEGLNMSQLFFFLWGGVQWHAAHGNLGFSYSQISEGGSRV